MEKQILLLVTTVQPTLAEVVVAVVELAAQAAQAAPVLSSFAT
jgi:hypothetical protein